MIFNMSETNSGGGGIETATVTIQNTQGEISYTDANMVAQVVSVDLSDVEMPIGSLVVVKNSTQPSPFPEYIVGLTQLWNYRHTRDRVAYTCYEVTG